MFIMSAHPHLNLLKSSVQIHCMEMRNKFCNFMQLVLGLFSTHMDLKCYGFVALFPSYVHQRYFSFDSPGLPLSINLRFIYLGDQYVQC